MRDPRQSIDQCEALHGSYTRCTGAEGHVGPHSNSSYVWGDKPTAQQKANFQEAIGGRTAKVLGFKDPQES